MCVCHYLLSFILLLVSVPIYLSQDKHTDTQGYIRNSFLTQSLLYCSGNPGEPLVYNGLCLSIVAVYTTHVPWLL